MPATNSSEHHTTFLRVVQGKLRQSVEASTPGAVYRTGKTPKGDIFEKNELVYNGWSGVVRDITFKDSEYGENCLIAFDDAIIALPTERREFSDFIKKFASADRTKEISISPYDFVTDEGKRKSGLTLSQSGQKLPDYFTTWTNGKATSREGFPVPEAENDKDSWKIYFIQVKKYLKTWIEKNPMKNDEGNGMDESMTNYQQDNMSDEEIPVVDLDEAIRNM